MARRKITIHDLGDPFGMITGSMVKFAVGGMRFDHEIEAGWALSPSLGMIAKDIEKLGLEIQDMREPITRSIVQVMIPSIDRNFREQGRPPWEELADYTIRVRDEPGPILERSGKLRRGVTKLHIWKIKSDSATIVSLPGEIWYGAIHQSGFGQMSVYASMARKMLKAHGKKFEARDVTSLMFSLLDQARGSPGSKREPTKSNLRTGIPQRRFLMFQEQDIDDILQIFAEWLEDKLREVGRFEGRSVRTVWGGPSFG